MKFDYDCGLDDYHINVKCSDSDNCTVVMLENVPVLKKYILNVKR